MSAPRKAIPGAARFLALHQRTLAVTCWASCEPDALAREHDARAFLMLPPGHDPATYSWPVSGRDLLLIGTGATDRRILSTCRALLRAGASKIVIIHGDQCRVSRLTLVHNKAVRHAA